MQGNQELQHHGVKGMKWGVRKKRLTFEKDGSAKTVSKRNAFLDADAKYGANRTSGQNKRINKLYERYDKAAAKDIKRALKNGDIKAAKSMAAGRMYLRMIQRSDMYNSAIIDAAVKAKVKVGEDFTHRMIRDDSFGGVKVTVNGVSSNYTLNPEIHNK